MMASVFIWWACEINTQVVRWLISSFLGRPCFQGILGVLFFATIFLEPAGVADEEVVFIDELDEVVGGSSWEGCRRQGSILSGCDHLFFSLFLNPFRE